MSLISNVKVYGFEDSVRASKYPMSTDISKCTDEITNTIRKLGSVPMGTGHDNFLNGIVVQFDLAFTVKAWTEAERYHFFDFVSSQSTMHRITKFDLDNAYIEYVDHRVIEIMKEKVENYNRLVAMKPETDLPKYNEEISEAYLGILYTNPCGFKLTARMTTNYRQLKTIYYQRKNHRLPEWREFCKWVETLPYFKEICMRESDSNE